jgi:hypothetical protein
MKKLLAVLMLAVASLTIAAPAMATAPPDHKVTICHAHPADSIEGPWVSITVDVASVGYQHQGHQSEHDGDIIPPWSYTDDEGTVFSYEGKGNQDILANGCVVPDAPPPPPELGCETYNTCPTPPPTDPPPTDEPPVVEPPPTDDPPAPPSGCKNPPCDAAFTGFDNWGAAGIAVGLAGLGGAALWYARKLKL